MTDNLNTAQLGALVWLKWRLFLNSMRSRRGATNRVASALGTLAAAALSLLLATGLGAGAYFVIRNRSGARAMLVAQDLATGASVDALFLLFGMTSMIYLVWATAPLSFGGGNQFDPGRRQCAEPGSGRRARSAEEVHPRSHRPRALGQARPGHRP